MKRLINRKIVALTSTLLSLWLLSAPLQAEDQRELLIEDENFDSGSQTRLGTQGDNGALRSYLADAFSRRGCTMNGERLTAPINPSFSGTQLYLRGNEKGAAGASVLKVVYLLAPHEHDVNVGEERYGLYFRVPVEAGGQIDQDGTYHCTADLLDEAQYREAFNTSTTTYQNSTTAGMPNRAHQGMKTCADTNSCNYKVGGDSVGGAVSQVIGKVTNRLIGNAQNELVYGPANKLAAANRKSLDDLADNLFNFGDDEDAETSEGEDLAGDLKAKTSLELWGPADDADEDNVH